ncbi:hypothetical protein TNCV_4859111 [Trichonephila clavipes]|nr:hypothetical protein TNCV_4859111 [Trichonephila clavipes]
MYNWLQVIPTIDYFHSTEYAICEGGDNTTFLSSVSKRTASPLSRGGGHSPPSAQGTISILQNMLFVKEEATQPFFRVFQNRLPLHSLGGGGHRPLHLELLSGFRLTGRVVFVQFQMKGPRNILGVHVWIWME